jgi:hypothetical protein
MDTNFIHFEKKEQNNNRYDLGFSIAIASSIFRSSKMRKNNN